MTEQVVWGADQVRARWPLPSASDDKYSRGVLGVITGSDAYPGAAALSVSGAIRAGAGMVRYVGPVRAQDLVLAHRPEAVLHHPGDVSESLPRAQAWLVGSGVADHPEQDAAIGSVIAAAAPMVVDAGALEAVARSRASGARDVGADQVLLTPHAQELQRTLAALRHPVTVADIAADRAGHARLLAEATRATVLLKGSSTVVAAPGGLVIELPVAPPWLATAGSGDVLAGIAGALLAHGLNAADAGASAAWIHAQAARLASGGGPIAALDIAHALGRAIAQLLTHGSSPDQR